MSRLRGEGKRFRWLAGVAGEPGAKPHFNEAGNGIEFGTSEGTRRTVRFSEDLAVKRALQAAQASAGGNGMYLYTGADGSTHFVMGLAQVPKKFRKNASPVESEIDTVVSGAQPPARARDDTWATTASPAFPSYFAPERAPPASIGQSWNPNECHIFGLLGPACQAVQLRENGAR